MVKGKAPNLKTETSYLSQNLVVAGSDEVGRGSLGGPVSVGIVVVDHTTRRPPRGLRDSKLLTPAEREALVPRIKSWAKAWSVGHASAEEIDDYGILRALRLAGERAISSLDCEPPSLVVLDGNYDWFRRPDSVDHSPIATDFEFDVQLKIKADMTCASVAGASVIAKVERDQLMTELSAQYPQYGWDLNKGYSTPVHKAALRELGPCEFHRQSWRLIPDEEVDLRDDDELNLDIDHSVVFST